MCVTEPHQIEYFECHRQMELWNEWYDSDVVHDTHLVIENVEDVKIDLHPKVFFLL